MRQAAYVIVGLVVLAATFQLFFRYEFIPAAGGATLRIDRLTQKVCLEPCTEPQPWESPSAKPVPSWLATPTQ